MKKVFFSIAFCLAVSSCNTDTCSKQIGVKLDYYLFEKIEMHGMTYCELVNNAIRGDERAILDLSKVHVSDGASYQHGAVLIQIIDKIGERKYIKIISVLTWKERKTIYYSSISAGLDYTLNPKYKSKSIEVVFPELTKHMENGKVQQ